MAAWFAPLPLLGLGLFGFYDRYVIIFIPVGMAIFAYLTNYRTTLSVPFQAMGLALLVAYAAFTVAGTHDYLASNRVRWTALHDLMWAAAVPITHIYGSSEFNGWYLYDRYSKKPWLWTDNDDYVVSSQALEGYQVIKRYSVQRWLFWQRHKGDILVERRIAGKSEL